MDKVCPWKTEESVWVDLHIDEVVQELGRATKKHPRPMRSTHEGYAVLLEEVDEVWDEIKLNNLERAREEMIQVAAMALRWLVDSHQEGF